MKIAGLHKVSLIDYPDLIAVSVFLAGCNLNCGYCYNRWMINEARVSEAMSVPEFLTWLESRVGLLEGVCISGGEPTIHSRLADFLRPIKRLGYAIKVDTNGTNPERLAYLLDQAFVDYVALDIKAPFDRRYHRVAGRTVDLVAIRQTLGLVRARCPRYEVRTTVSPHVARELADVEALDEDALHRIAERLVERVPLVKVRGE